jgi:NitT/TauT family transport system substrate-binding protein
MRSFFVSALIAGFAFLGFAGPSLAEVKEVRLARQLGLGYLQFYLMQELKLVEKQARAMGLGEVAARWTPLGTPTALADVLLSENVDAIGVGLPTFLTLWDRSRGAVKAVVAMNQQPAYLNTRNPNIKSIRDYTDGDRIALPAPKVSVQAIMLQMIAEKTFGPGKYDVLDKLTVAMSSRTRPSARSPRPTTRPTGPTRSASSP